MGLADDVKKELEAGTICEEVSECIAGIAGGHQGLFEHLDRTGCYCFIPSTFACPLKYYPGDVKLDPSLCLAEELRAELFANPLKAVYLKGVNKK